MTSQKFNKKKHESCKATKLGVTQGKWVEVHVS